MTKDAYHHGNLRAALLAAALDALQDIPAAKLSLRQLAIRLDVSANAPYAHFASKDALLAAVRREGFVRLKSEMLEALAAAEAGGQARLAALGRAYLRFGRGHPNLYALMFSGTGTPGGTASQAETDSFALLRQSIDTTHRDPDLPVFAWALVHGLVTLDTARALQFVDPPGAAIEDLAPRLAAILVAGEGGAA